MTRHAARLCLLALIAGAVVFEATPASAQNVTVTAATPTTGEQNSVSLVVKITGKNFAPGARADFFKSGTSDPSGVTVRGTQFVSSTEVDATLDIGGTASLSYYDIRVANTNGRTGKGSDMFQVVQPGAAKSSCVTEPLDTARFELVASLNHLNGSAPAFGPFLGVSSALAPATLALPGGVQRTVLVAGVGTTHTASKMEIFVLDSTTGQLLDGNPMCATCGVQVHQTLTIPNAGGAWRMTSGDLNADGLPDFAVFTSGQNQAAVFVGALTGAGQLQYAAVPLPAVPANCCSDIAMGDLDGIPGDEIALGNVGGGSGKNAVPGTIHLYRMSGGTLSLYRSLVPTANPAMKMGDLYGYAVAIGDVTFDGRPDLMVGAPVRTVNGIVNAGAVFVQPGSGAAPPYTLNTTPLTLSSAQAVGVNIGGMLGVGDVNHSGALDVVAPLRTAPGGGEVVPGPVVNGEIADPTLFFGPRSGLSSGWATNKPAVGDLNGDGLADVVVGAPDVTTGAQCPDQGMAYVFLGQSTGGWNRLTMQAQAETDDTKFGYSVAVADGYPFILVTDNFANVGSSTSAGQAYIYRVK